MGQAELDMQNLQRAEKLFMAGNFKESEPLFRSLAKSRHVGPRAECDLGLLYLQTGKSSEAEALFNAIISAGHRLAEAHYGLGVIFEAYDPGYARAQYEFALNINPRHNGSRNRLKKLATSVQPPPRLESFAAGDDAPESNEKGTRKKSDEKSDPTREGIAKNVRVRTEPRGYPARQIQIIEFSLHRGEGLGPLPVYMSGHRVKGTVKEGDRIVIKGRLPRKGRIFETDSIFNETAGGYVEMSGMTLSDRDPGKILGIILLIIIIVAVSIAVLLARSR